MEIEFILLPLVISFIMYKHVFAGLHLIDKNTNYNNSQENFIQPPCWVNKLYKFQSTLLPKYICYRFYSVFLVILAPICVVIYLISNDEDLVMLLLKIQVICIIVDFICNQLHFHSYKKRLANDTKNKRQEKTGDGDVS